MGLRGRALSDPARGVSSEPRVFSLPRRGTSVRVRRFSMSGLVLGPPGVGATTHIAGVSRVGVGGMGGRTDGIKAEAEVAEEVEAKVCEEETDAERVERLNMVADLGRSLQ